MAALAVLEVLAVLAGQGALAMLAVLAVLGALEAQEVAEWGCGAWVVKLDCLHGLGGLAPPPPTEHMLHPLSSPHCTASMYDAAAQDNIELYIITKPFVGNGDFKQHMHK